MSDYLVRDLDRYGVAVRDRSEIAELHGDDDGLLAAVTLRDGQRLSSAMSTSISAACRPERPGISPGARRPPGLAWLMRTSSGGAALAGHAEIRDRACRGARPAVLARHGRRAGRGERGRYDRDRAAGRGDPRPRRARTADRPAGRLRRRPLDRRRERERADRRSIAAPPARRCAAAVSRCPRPARPSAWRDRGTGPPRQCWPRRATRRGRPGRGRGRTRSSALRSRRCGASA